HLQDVWRALFSGAFHGIDPYRGIEEVKRFVREPRVCMTDALVRLQDMIAVVFPGYFRPSESGSIATAGSQDDDRDQRDRRVAHGSESTDVGSPSDGNDGLTTEEGASVTTADGID
ncbi:unnamed protein product, partial [Sphacelaria rigidula]